MSSLSTSLKNSYQRWLHPYEEYLRLAKPGVHQQLEYEYGGPLTPSPANSPLKKSHQHTPSSLRGESPAVRASEALNASMKDEFEKSMRNIPMLDSPASTPQPVSSGFTPVNAGGFTPVNAAPATFAPVNINRREREESSSFTPPRRPFDSPMSSAKATPEYRPSALSSAPVVNGFTSNPLLKRQLSHDSLDSRGKGSQAEDSENGGRRSKRLKKGMWLLHFLSISTGCYSNVMRCQGCGQCIDFSCRTIRLAMRSRLMTALQMRFQLWLDLT
jgi:histone demethylase JARID1